MFNNNPCLGGAIGRVAVRAPGYSDRRVWIRGPGWPDQVIAAYALRLNSRAGTGVLFNL